MSEMSERCLGWRALLSRRADGDLSRYEWEALEDHLGRAAGSAGDAARSDRMLHLAHMTREDFGLDSRCESTTGRSGILLALGLPGTPVVGASGFSACRLRELWARWEAIPNLYLTQIAGGTLAAASLTAVFLLTALRSSPRTPVRTPPGSASRQGARPLQPNPRCPWSRFSIAPLSPRRLPLDRSLVPAAPLHNEQQAAPAPPPLHLPPRSRPPALRRRSNTVRSPIPSSGVRTTP